MEEKDDIQTLENLIRGAIAAICVDEYTPAICDLAQALAILDREL